MKEAVLGADYELSVVIVDETKIQELNRTYRGIDKPTDILSFPLSDTSGEIFMNPEQTALQAREFDRTFDNFLGFLFIHGLLHLNGMEHGSTMERAEEKVRTQFGI
jgi:probable rRNA maturation factor